MIMYVRKGVWLEGGERERKEESVGRGARCCKRCKTLFLLPYSMF